jgi:hypothetical protein
MLLYFCTEEYVDGQPSSTLLVYFSGVLGIAYPGTSFQRPRSYTTKLSALIYCIRLCLLEASLPRFAHPSIDWEARPLTGQLDRLNCLRERSMCISCQAPMAELLSLRSYGRKMLRVDGPSFRVDWSHDAETVRWDDGRLTMTQFRQLGQDAMQAATQLCQRLMYGLEANIDLGRLRDRIANSAAGYSFVQDPANGLASAYLDLSSRACLASIDGLMSRNSWNYDAVSRYLEGEADLLRQLMLVLYFQGGQAPRSTEFFSVECENGPSTSRGVYVHAGFILFVTRHSKAGRTTNQEFQVARYLPGKASALVATYLVYIRPMVSMLNRNCYGRRASRRLLFSSVNQPDRLWTAGCLSKAIKGCAKQACGYEFGVRTYRQLSIAITERHVKQISQPFNRYDDKASNTDIEVAFAWQSGHRPLQRGTMYGMDAAYPDALQPALLRIYHWTSKEWHNFLNLDGATEAAVFASTPLALLEHSEDSGLRKRQASLSPCGRRGRRRLASHSPLPLGHRDPLYASKSPRLAAAPDQQGLLTERPALYFNGQPADVFDALSQKASAKDNAAASLEPLPKTTETPVCLQAVGAAQVALCSQHGTCFTGQTLDGHLAYLHKMPRAARLKVLSDFVAAGLVANKDAVPLPQSNLMPFRGLPVQQGYQCCWPSCGYTTICEHNAKRHCRSHGWSSGPRGRKQKQAPAKEQALLAPVAPYLKVAVQTLWAQKQHIQYFVVKEAEMEASV